ncbi:MAG TPA: hypothetical protein VFG80_02965 [Myxococcota bacterium]|nr:hypothetical protein [Myxococcota bacterium]
MTRGRARAAALACAALLAGSLGDARPGAAAPAETAPVAPKPGAAAPRSYPVLYDARLVPTQRAAEVTIRVSNSGRELRSLRFRIDPARHRDFSGDGLLTVGPDTVEWQPPAGEARLRYVFSIDDLRDERSYDARCAQHWALFRGDDLVPPARVRALRGAESQARLRLRLPEGWSAAAPYARTSAGLYLVDHADRRFDRPVGWIVAGRRMGVVREKVAGVHVAVAGPVGQGLRRLDLLALLRWTLPELRKILGPLPERLLVVGAGDPMWRGGLSGPGSFFIHADRPLLSNDGTSPVLHELVHTALGLRGGPGGDWIVEGLAEHYSLELLERSRTLSRRRAERVRETLAARGRGASPIEGERATGPEMARAASALTALDRELRTRSQGARSLDDVVRDLVARREPLTSGRLRAAAERVNGAPLAAFFRRWLPASSDAAN